MPNHCFIFWLPILNDQASESASSGRAMIGQSFRFTINLSAMRDKTLPTGLFP
jgi:hypothetical protein